MKLAASSSRHRVTGCLLPALLLGACLSAQESPGSAVEAQAAAPPTPTLSSLEQPISIARYQGPGDPNLDPSWSWTASGAGHTMYYSVNGSTPIRLDNVQVPFYTSGHPLATDQKDMYPEDGWMLAYRDFGTPSDAPAMPFFALYNRYRGTLRVMFYNAPTIAYTAYRVELSFRNTAAAGALLTFSDPERTTTADFDRSKTESYMGRMAQFRGWAYADFSLVGYDPALHPDAKLHLDLSGIDESQVVLDSTKFTLSEVLDNANPSSSRPLSLSSVLDAFNKGQKYYKDVASAKKSLQDRIDKTGTSNPWWKGPAKALVGGAVGSAAPYIGALVGFVTSFFGSKSQQTAREPLNFQGSLQLQGTISLTRQILALDLALSPGAAAPDFYRPVQRVPWGVFNLTTKPNVRKLIWDDYCEEDGYGTVFWCRWAYDFLVAPLSYVVNPDAGVTIQSVKTAFTNYGGPPTAFGNPGATYYGGDVQYYPYYYVRSQYGAWPQAVAVEVTLRISQPTRYSDRDLVLYKVYPPGQFIDEWQ